MSKIHFTIIVEDSEGQTIETHLPVNQFEFEQFLYALNNFYNVLSEESLQVMTIKTKGTRSDTTLAKEMAVFEELYPAEPVPALVAFDELQEDVVYEEPVEEVCPEEVEVIEEYVPVAAVDYQDEYDDE